MIIFERNIQTTANAGRRNYLLHKTGLDYFIRQILKNKYLYIMMIPVLAYYLIFHYGPMYGVIIAFKNYDISKGFTSSPWVGLKNFQEFFQSYYCFRIIRNTFLISIYSLIYGFPAPIILALLLNETRNRIFKKTIQTISYMPHFISIVVAASILLDFTSSKGFFNTVIQHFGGQGINFMIEPGWFRTIYVGSGMWQNLGWDSIIYLAVLSSIDPALYESAVIDGANRWRQLIHVTIPSLLPTIIILLLLRFGEIMSVGYEKIILLYNPTIYETADVISTFVYRKGLLDFAFSYSTAVVLFNSVVNFIILLAMNKLSRAVTETSLW